MTDTGLCPNCDEVYQDGWACETCGEHGCELCEPDGFRDSEGGHTCLGCYEAIARSFGVRA